jgi:8-oxo-dGTP pyrophosphatase MutT (NUDIX family)
MTREEGGEISYDAEGRVRWGRRAAGLIIERVDNGKILLVLRSAEVMDPGVWGIPGGRVEPDETELEGALQEAEEELGTLPHIRIVGETRMESGDFSYTTFFAQVPGPIAEVWKPELNWENDDWKWFSKKRPPKNLHPGVMAALQA